ncbi:MAG: MBL fold metallo-hydrolase [Gammaproteobacteria bacterium]|nr:MAG: MBL fold metallo-hydrolase [Gammaproteobacteria bacterium]RTZ78267.1 MAG: MBL fold metallo-hydrolase [Gammaproteobacteria bacterium]
MQQAHDFRQLDDHTWLIDTGLNRPGHTGCYLVRYGDELALIDCGASNSVPRLLDVLARLGFSTGQVRYILPTHVHLDHAGGAGRLLAHCPEATLATHHKGLPHLVDPERLQQGAMAVYGEAAFRELFGRLEPAPAERCRALHEGDSLELGGQELHFIETPGHANHHGCFFDPQGGNLFTGDIFGLHYPELDHDGEPLLIATTTPVAFDPVAWQESIDRMLALQPRRACLTHFGPLDDPARWAPRLRQSIEDHVTIALEEEKKTPEGREARLLEDLRRLLVGQALAHNPGLDQTRVEKLLEVDLTLNAQGLAIWLARRARHREKGL